MATLKTTYKIDDTECTLEEEYIKEEVKVQIFKSVDLNVAFLVLNGSVFNSFLASNSEVEIYSE